MKKLFWSYTRGSKIAVFASMAVVNFKVLLEPQKWRYWAKILHVKLCWPYLQVILLPFFPISSGKKVWFFCVSLPVHLKESLLYDISVKQFLATKRLMLLQFSSYWILEFLILTPLAGFKSKLTRIIILNDFWINVCPILLQRN